MASEFEIFLDEVNTPIKAVEGYNKRKYLKKFVENGGKLPGKTPWTVDCLD